ncbi:Cleavage and polyadenylation specificity factor subunit 3-I [Vitis vinifera]|uniref:Cleavage and polyadenylation specificity factor subunit 3-I n=1 Tax=Vitis vinifera TaxID=29760 RepID=A0A438J6W8_VITVI|nr:Cleavage and polyadenylation specificity factor subunit 3-I [Vitis vinifera]
MEKLMRWGGSNRSLSPSLLTATPKLFPPKNCQSVEMYFNSEKMAKTIGRLAEKTPGVGETVSGLLVKKGFTYQIMAPDDLHVFSQLSTANVTQRITIPYTGAFGVIKHRLKQIYESVESLPDEESEVPAFRVHERVTVKHEGHKTEEENGKKAEKVIHALLVSLFGDVKLGENGNLVISVDGNVAHLDKQSGNVESENEGLKERVRVAFQRIQNAVKPIPLSVS